MGVTGAEGVVDEDWDEQALIEIEQLPRSSNQPSVVKSPDIYYRKRNTEIQAFTRIILIPDLKKKNVVWAQQNICGLDLALMLTVFQFLW